MSDAADEDIEKRIEVREPAITVLEAQLVSSSPERVLSWLETRASRPKESVSDADAEVEKTLLARQEPLINLGLAQYGIEDETVRALFTSIDPIHRRALRLAVLSNQAVHRHRGYRTGDLVEALISYSGNIGQWLSSLSNEEIRALFLNPTLSDNLLIDFLEKKKGWQELDERRQLFVLSALAKNPRMSARYDSVIMDGYAEYKHRAVFDAAWNLAATAPAKIQWCWGLYELYSHTRPSSTVKDPLEIAKRWFPDPTDARVCTAEESSLESGHLGAFALLRGEIARLALNGSSTGTQLDVLLNHEDLPVRLAACRYGHLTPAQIHACMTRDPKFAFDSVVRNESLWRRLPTREILKKLAWEQPDPKSYMDAPNMYKYTETEIRQKYPAWFEEEDREPVDEDTLPVTRGEFKQALVDLTEKVELTYPTLGTIQSNVLAILARSGWLWWGLAAVLVILVIKMLGGSAR